MSPDSRDSRHLINALQLRLDKVAKRNTKDWWEEYLRNSIEFRGVNIAYSHVLSVAWSGFFALEIKFAVICRPNPIIKSTNPNLEQNRFIFLALILSSNEGADSIIMRQFQVLEVHKKTVKYQVISQ